MSLPTYVPPPPDSDREASEIEAFKARIAGKRLGEALAVRLDLQEQISHFDSAPNDWHDAEHRDKAMTRLARLRRELVYVTGEIERGAYA